MYNPKSNKAEEFINHEEVLASVQYAAENKNNIELIKLLCKWLRLLSLSRQKQAYSTQKNDTGRNQGRSYRTSRYGTQTSCD